MPSHRNQSQPSRRDFLRTSALAAGTAGVSLADALPFRSVPNAGDVNCIVLFLVGGPSHLDTWDLKPDAPDQIRGPFRPIQTNVPGIDIGECFPLMAKQADHFALLRSVHHQSAPIHETGHQLMQTGKLACVGVEHPYLGSVVSYRRGTSESQFPSNVVLPGPIGNTGVSIGHGQSAGYLGASHEPYYPDGLQSSDETSACTHSTVASEQSVRIGSDAQPSPRAWQAFDIDREPRSLLDRYGRTAFGRNCLRARRLIESGTRFVTVNMFDTVYDQITWDMHADGGSLTSTLSDYKESLCPTFDMAYSALIEDLQQRGMLSNTMVVAMGEFGRTPHLNPRGGRDHWPGVWTILFAGGPVIGGQVIGASDKIGASPADRPISPAEVVASIYAGLGIEPDATLPGPDGRPVPIVDAQPISGLLA